ncbi:MAG: type II secretion system protein N [Gammaproteobacteria bacterium]
MQWFLWTWSPSGRWANSRADRWLRHTIESVLGMLIVVLLASFWAPHTRIVSRTPFSRSASSPVLAPAAMADKIVAAHLFGQVPAQTPAAAPAAQSITVDGIVYAGAEDSEAVLTLNGKTEIYKEGETLSDGEKITAIGPADVQLIDNGSTRRLTLAHYGDPGSEGPAAYAALLHGTGLNASATDSALTMLPGAAPVQPAEPFMPLPSVSPADFVPVSSARVVQIPATATPLEQLQALRQQLIHGP